MGVPMSSKEEFLRQQLLFAQEARDRIRTPDRWTQRRMQRKFSDDRPTQYCAAGAIYGDDLAPFFDNSDAPQRATIHRLFKKLPQPLCHLALMHWNDDPATTHAEVLALFDEVITDLKEEIMREMPNVGALARAL